MNRDIDPLRTDKVLAAVVEYIDRHGHAPSVRAVQECAGISSVSVADYHLRKLERMGLIERGACGCPGALRVVDIGGQLNLSLRTEVRG